MHTRRTEIFIATAALAAISSLAHAEFHSPVLHPAYAVAVLALSAATSRLIPLLS